MSAERQQMTELNQQLHVLEQTLKGWRSIEAKALDVIKNLGTID
jgi:hypothetical protein